MIDKLKNYVTFSEQLKKEVEHGKEFTVGGKITSIVNTALLVEKVEEPKDHFVYLMLDDAVGEQSVALPLGAYEHAVARYGIGVGSIVLVQGMLQILDFSFTYKDTRGMIHESDGLNHPEQSNRIVGWKVTPLPEEKPVLTKD
ncbi:hypothetical protein_gp222 [Bacillus phage vB_BceM_WH1]|nr:hypothetical protein_gp222 [Bacillus phage vB_BceM_WH1]